MNTNLLMLLNAPNLSFTHAFTTRIGGVSLGSYQGLNLDEREDEAQAVAQNRLLLAQALGIGSQQFARLTQIHGTKVIEVTQAGLWTGDALVTKHPNIVLAIGTADCYPLLFEDATAGVIGAAHAGWKGTVGRIAAKTISAMLKLGATLPNIKVAVGPGICAKQYEVGVEVAHQFTQAGLDGHLHHVLSSNIEVGSTKPDLTKPDLTRLDLAGANQTVLLEAGILPEHIWLSGRCSTEPEFYSFRRDAGKTGRMWAVIGMALTDAFLDIPANTEASINTEARA